PRRLRPLRPGVRRAPLHRCHHAGLTSRRRACPPSPTSTRPSAATRPSGPSWTTSRSEEHTSELQSRFDLVCRLLLEKKKPIDTLAVWAFKNKNPSSVLTFVKAKNLTNSYSGK